MVHMKLSLRPNWLSGVSRSLGTLENKPGWQNGGACRGKVLETHQTRRPPQCRKMEEFTYERCSKRIEHGPPSQSQNRGVHIGKYSKQSSSRSHVAKELRTSAVPRHAPISSKNDQNCHSFVRGLVRRGSLCSSVPSRCSGIGRKASNLLVPCLYDE